MPENIYDWAGYKRRSRKCSRGDHSECVTKSPHPCPVKQQEESDYKNYKVARIIIDTLLERGIDPALYFPDVDAVRNEIEQRHYPEPDGLRRVEAMRLLRKWESQR